MKKIYGMDLGTTNSMLGYEDILITEMVPSIAKISTGEAGEKLRDDFETSRSFKVDISLGIEGNESVMASSLVLKEMKRLALQKGHDVEDVVISVPAYFSDNQRQATIKAAEMAGMNVVSLINEPTAAALKYSTTMKKLVLVFDLGGGTFDVSIIDTRFGTYDVQDTDGEIVGGDDLDRAIQRYIMKQAKFKIHRLDKADLVEIKCMCERAKIQIQKTRQDYFFDFSTFGDNVQDKYPILTVKDYVAIMKHTFKPTIAKTKQVKERAIMHGDKYEIILVGGSTLCPFLQEWIEDEMLIKPAPVTYDPNKIVGEGACLYGKLLRTGEAATLVSDVTKALSIGMNDGTVRTIIERSSKIPCADTLMVTNPEEADGLELKLYQGDSTMAIHNEYIGTLKYPFAERKAAGTATVNITVTVSKGGIISFEAKEPLKSPVKIELGRQDTKITKHK